MLNPLFCEAGDFPYNTGMKKTTRNRSWYVKKLDTVFSQFIRLRAADHIGYSACVTCGTSKPWKEQQCGHFESRGKFGTRWNEKNCNVQCYRCNVLLKGNYPAYSRYLVRMFGASILDELELMSNQSPKFSISELQLMTDDYTARVRTLISQG